jgi:serine/threonine-protein kinase RsbW
MAAGAALTGDGSMMPAPIDLTIRNDLADLPTVSQAVDRIAIAAGMRPNALAQFQVALDEILSNIIRYAWSDGGSHQLHITINVLDDAIEVVVVDDGQPFDPRAQAPPDLAVPGNRPRPGGLGIHLVRQLVDGFGYVRDNGCNRVTLTKRYASGLSQVETE